jgi:hypothetical protein
MRRAVVFVVLGFASCATAPTHRAALGFAVSHEVEPAKERSRVDKVIVVTMDGTRWQEVFVGADPALGSTAEAPEAIMPTLHRWMTSEGVAIGAPGHGEIWASGPNFVSLPGYTEIFTGRPSACHDNDCRAIRVPTLVDQLLDEGGDATIVSSWERISLVAALDPSRIALSTGRHVRTRTDGLDLKAIDAAQSTGAWPGTDDYRRDELTIRVALGSLGRHMPRFSFIGLGDPDEHAHRGDYKRYLASLRQADAFLGELEKHIDDHTVVFVTADHGRSAGFRDHGGWHESGRVWLGVRAPCVSARGFVDSVPLRLADIAPTIRCMMGMRSDDGPDAGHSIAALCDASGHA